MGLAELRKSKNLTQRELAERAGISNVTIANYERGDRDTGNMTLRNAIRIADALKVRDLRKLLDD
jgi:transcriptional regulator with XRE-family HTH domain